MRKISRNTELEVCTPEEVWGVRLAHGTVRGAPSVVVEMRGVPEGLLDVLRCTRCGTVLETVRDLRRRERWDEIGVRADAQKHNEKLLDLWAARHQDCISNTLEPAPEIIAVRDRLVERAARDVKTGQVFPATARIVLDTGGAEPELVALPYGQPPFRSRQEKRVRIERMKAVARDYLRRSDVEILGAVGVCEAWYSSEEEAGRALELPSEATGAREGIVAEVRSEQATQLRVAPIERASGVPNAGHGKLVEPPISGTPEHSRMLDGLLAPDATRRG